MSSATVGDPDTTIVELVTDTAHVGWREVCPTGPLPQPDHAGSIRADLGLLGPTLICLDPRRINLIHDAMASTMDGGHSAKSAIDITAPSHHTSTLKLRWTPTLGICHDPLEICAKLFRKWSWLPA